LLLPISKCRDIPVSENHRDDDNTRSFVALTKGTRVGHYKIISKIGAGGMGEVYLAEDSQLDRKVALKFLPSHLCQDEASRARFTREAKAAAKLDHPNIVPVYEVGEFQGRPFFAMAHIEGKSLRDVIKEGKLSVSEAIQFTMQILEGLHKAHEFGVVHRDVKPGNIIIDNENRPRILDFGLATVSGEEKLTKTGSTLGTVGYMSPEQIDGTKVDHRSDIFSVGVILYEMVRCGRGQSYFKFHAGAYRTIQIRRNRRTTTNSRQGVGQRSFYPLSTCR
jgi:serine/threonine protein kinase